MQINFEDTDSNTSKLTIAKDRILLKFAKDICDSNKERMSILAQKVINELYKPDMLTRRGKFFFYENNIYTISMYIQTRKSNTVDPITFSEG